MFLYYNCSVGKTRNRYFRRASHEGRDEGAKIYAKNAQVPAYPCDEALEIYKENVTTPGTEYVFAAKVNSEDGNEDYYNELKDAYKAEITEYLIGNCTIDEAFDNYKVRRDEIINK